MKKGLYEIRVDIIIFQILIMLYLFLFGNFIGTKFVVMGFIVTALNLIYILVDLDKIQQMISKTEENAKNVIMINDEKNKSYEHIKKIREIFKTDDREALLKYIEKSQKEYCDEEIPEYDLEILNIVLQRYAFICKKEDIEFTYDIQQNVKILLEAVGFTGEQLCTVLGNLFDNSIDILKSKPSDRKLRLSIRGDGENIRIKVANNGEKISNRIKEKIFNYGFSTKAEGRGAGLFIVYKLIEKIGAVLSVDSDDKQTSFEIMFELK